ncbi:hypothetical protein B0H13DRAFT_2374133 [Mycena leptocephala]|nr:hypothetical protein B0H13DRAFT_2374133 [Mycena leptocephala]
MPLSADIRARLLLPATFVASYQYHLSAYIRLHPFLVSWMQILSSPPPTRLRISRHARDPGREHSDPHTTSTISTAALLDPRSGWATSNLVASPFVTPGPRRLDQNTGRPSTTSWPERQQDTSCDPRALSTAGHSANLAASYMSPFCSKGPHDGHLDCMISYPPALTVDIGGGIHCQLCSPNSTPAVRQYTFSSLGPPGPYGACPASSRRADDGITSPLLRAGCARALIPFLYPRRRVCVPLRATDITHTHGLQQLWPSASCAALCLVVLPHVSAVRAQDSKDMVSDLVSSCLLLSLPFINEYSYILIAACLVFAQRVVLATWPRYAAILQRSDDNGATTIIFRCELTGSVPFRAFETLAL